MTEQTTHRPLDRDEVNLDEVVRILTEDYHVPAYVEMTGGGCATIYAGDPVLWAESEGDTAYPTYPVVAGPGTYKHRETGVSTGSLFELVVGLDYVVDEGESYVDCAAVGAHDAQAIARLTALMVSKQETLDVDTLDEFGFDGSLRSAPAWLVHEAEVAREASDRHNERLRRAYAKGATVEQAVAYAAGDTDTYDEPPAGKGAHLIDAIEQAIAAALAAPAVEPILTPIFIDDEDPEDDGLDGVLIVCPNCLGFGVEECDYGALGFNHVSPAEIGKDGTIYLGIGGQDRDRHTLAFVCRNEQCRTFFDIDYTAGYSIDWA